MHSTQNSPLIVFSVSPLTHLLKWLSEQRVGGQLSGQIAVQANQTQARVHVLRAEKMKFKKNQSKTAN